MRKSAKYSPSRRTAPLEVEAPAAETVPPAPERPRRRWRAAVASTATQPRLMWAAIALLSVALIAMVWQQQRGGAAALTQKDIDAAVLRTLTTQVMPSPTARAAEKIRPSVVRVLSYGKNEEGKEVEQGVGTGVVIVDKGVILTNLHVVQGADRLKRVGRQCDRRPGRERPGRAAGPHHSGRPVGRHHAVHQRPSVG